MPSWSLSLMSFHKLAAKWWQHERPTNKLMIKTKVIAIAVISIWSKFYLGLSALTLGGGRQARLWWGHTPSQHNHEDCQYQPSIAIIMFSKGLFACYDHHIGVSDIFGKDYDHHHHHHHHNPPHDHHGCWPDVICTCQLWRLFCAQFYTLASYITKENYAP